jgi:prepilin-type processing-associated H-X9-DG protein
MSESILGDGPEAFTDRALVNNVMTYAVIFSVPLTANRCSRAVNWNLTNRRGFSWANGEYRTGLYNHARTPNSSLIDCIGVEMASDVKIQYAGYGWRAARSRHPGGVNVLMADGSAQFVEDGVAPAVWTALSTRAGGEVAVP